MAGCPPNGSCQLAVYSQLVTSSIMGPEDEASESGPLRATLPTGSDCVHIGYACSLVPHNVAHAHCGYPRGCHHPNGHGTQGQFKGHHHQLWHPKTGHHFHKATWWSWWLYKCQCLYWQGGSGWGGSLWQRGWRLYW